MIGTPHNDHDCLGAITDLIVAKVEARDPDLLAAAAEAGTLDNLIASVRAQPQRDDLGLACDGPKVEACAPPQRFRWLPPDGNCVERAGNTMAVAQFLDAPEVVWRLATTNTPHGMHTYPTRDGEPVILDPMQSRNALRAGLFRIGRNSLLKSPGLPPDTATRRLRLERLIGTDETRGVRGDLARARASKAAGHTTWVDGKAIEEAIATYERALVTYQRLLDELPRNASRSARNRAVVALTPTEAVDWIGELAVEPAERFADGPQRACNGHRAMRGVLVGRALCFADVSDVAFVLALADREARLYGPSGPRIVRTTARALGALDQRNARRWTVRNARRNLQIDGYRIEPNTRLLAALGRVGGRLGGRVGIEALKVQLATMGVTPPILNTLEHELNREGLSLGPFAAPPPMLGSLGAMAPEALAGRWLAQKL